MPLALENKSVPVTRDNSPFSVAMTEEHDQLQLHYNARIFLRFRTPENIRFSGYIQFLAFNTVIVIAEWAAVVYHPAFAFGVAVVRPSLTEEWE